VDNGCLNFREEVEGRREKQAFFCHSLLPLPFSLFFLPRMHHKGVELFKVQGVGRRQEGGVRLDCEIIPSPSSQLSSSNTLHRSCSG
jgi:hypothetical protein